MKRYLTWALVLAVLVLPSVAAAQIPAEAARSSMDQRAKVFVPTPAVTLVLVEDLAVDTARAMILRRPLPARGESVILVTERTTAADLVKAIDVLNHSRWSRGDVIQTEMRAFVSAAQDQPAQRSRNYGPATRDLARLRTAAPVDVGGVGHHRALTVTLPSYAGRSAGR